jgi:thioredoxin 1
MKDSTVALAAIVLAVVSLGTIQYFKGGSSGVCAATSPKIVDSGRSNRIEGKEARKMGQVAEVDEASFEGTVLKSDTPALVDFWAPWCMPCKMLAPTVEELSKDYAGRLKVVKVNTDDNNKLASEHGIRGIPTLIIFKGGKEVERIVGVQSKSALAAKIDGVLDGKK